MKKETLIANQRRLQRALIWWICSVTGSMLCVVVLAANLPESWKDGEFWCGMTRHQVVLKALLTIFVVGMFGGICVLARRYDICCPKCGKSIQGGFYTALAITTGKCGHCGETIVDG